MGDVLYSGVSLATRTLKAAQHVYVAPSGNDANRGTQAAPKLTLGSALAAIPPVLDGVYVIHLAAGAYTWPAPPAVVSRPGSSIVVIGDDFNVIASGTVEAGSTANLVKTSGLTAGAHIGQSIEFLTGAGAGGRKTIIDNTATDLRMPVNMRQPLTGNPYVPAIGDTFRIFRPAASIANGTSFPTQYGGVVVVPINVAFTGGLTTGRTAPQACYGVEVQGLIHVGSKLQAGLGVEPFGATAVSGDLTINLSAIWAAALAATYVYHSWHGWGLTHTVASYANALVCSPGTCFEGFLVSQYGALDKSAIGDGEITLLGGRLANIGGDSGSVSILNDPLMFGGAPFLLANVSNNQSGVLCVNGGMRFTCTGDLEITAVGTTAAIVCTECGDVSIRGSATCVGTSSARFIACGGNLTVQGTLTVSASNGGGLYCHSGCRLFAGTYLGASSLGSILQDGAQVVARYFTEIGATNGAGLAIYAGARLSMQGSGIASTLQISATAPNTGAVLLRQGGEIIVGHSTSISIANLSTAANSDGLRAYAGARAVLMANPTISTAGSSGYGANLRGGGAFLCSAQPTNVVGPTSDFTISTTAGDDFADTALATSLSAKVAGMSVVQRTG